MKVDENTDLEEYLADISSDAFIADAAKKLKQPVIRIRDLVSVYANEARFGYALIKNHLNRDMRILEVGAGIGALSAFLHLRGYHVVAIEPSGKGFDLNKEIGQCVKSWLKLRNFEYIDMGVEELTSSRIGTVDIIYSVNVIEHLPDLPAAFRQMKSVLSDRGLMIHTCPNYHVPYEPHFAVPLIPFLPSATRFFLSKEISTSALWQSFNFVTSTQLTKIANQLDLEISFERGTMYQSLIRLSEDPLFAERHRGLVTWIYRTLSTTGLIHLIRYWPVILSTPVNFTCRHKAGI